MSEISPVSAPIPVLKPAKLDPKRDSTKKPPRRPVSKPIVAEESPQPAQHIDEHV